MIISSLLPLSLTFALAQSAPPDPPMELALRLIRVSGDVEKLRTVEAAAVGEKASFAEIEKALQAYGDVRTLAEFRSPLLRDHPVELRTTYSIPEGQPSGGAVHVRYARLGCELNVTGRWAGRPAARKVALQIAAEFMERARQGDQLAAPGRFATDLELPADVTRVVVLETEPRAQQGATEAEIHVLAVSARPRTPGSGPLRRGRRSTAPASAPAVGAPQPAHMEVEIFGVSIAPDRPLDLDLVTSENPTGKVLLERLSALGTAGRVASFSSPCDLATVSNFTTGVRTPSVQDVRIDRQGRVTPSVTYEEVGAIVEFGPARWEWGDICHLPLRLEMSGIGESAVSVSPGVTLPAFQQMRFEQQIELFSGKPVYVTTALNARRGENTMVAVARIVLTRER